MLGRVWNNSPYPTCTRCSSGEPATYKWQGIPRRIGNGQLTTILYYGPWQERPYTD
jgi:hypothetical protein